MQSNAIRIVLGALVQTVCIVFKQSNSSYAFNIENKLNSSKINQSFLRNHFWAPYFLWIFLTHSIFLAPLYFTFITVISQELWQIPQSICIFLFFATCSFLILIVMSNQGAICSVHPARS